MDDHIVFYILALANILSQYVLLATIHSQALFAYITGCASY